MDSAYLENKKTNKKTTLESGNKPTNADNNSHVLTDRHHFIPEQQTTHGAFKIPFTLTKVMVIRSAKL